MTSIDVLTARQELDNNYVLVVTTNSIEKDAVRAVLSSSAPATIRVSNQGSRIGLIGSSFVLCLSGTSGAQEPQSVGRIVRRFLTEQNGPRPSLVVLIGFCWGNPNKVKPGQLIVSTDVWGLNQQRLSPGRSTWKMAQTVSPLNRADWWPEVVNEIEAHEIGPISSTETYFASTPARDELLAEYPSVLGGEMEAFDLIPDLHAPWIIVKAISDDAGNEVGRNSQRDAAARAASALPKLIRALSARSVLPRAKEGPTIDLLRSVIIGRGIRLSQPLGGEYELNSYLNDVIGPQVHAKLTQYASESDPSGLLPNALTDVLLELSQNALRHGGARQVTASFLEIRVVLEDDGNEFGLAGLSESERGGGQAWQKFVTRFLDSGLVRFSHRASKSKRGNAYVFELTGLSNELRRAKENCSIRIDAGNQGEATGRYGWLLHDPACSSLYLDVSFVRMTSRHLQIVDGLAAMLGEGKGLFVACRNQEEVLWYQQRLKDFAGPKLHIFVGAQS